MRNIKIKNLLNKAASKNSSFTSFIPYIDNSGNKLQEEDILFTNEEGYYKLKGNDSLDDVIFYTVSSPDITAIYDDTKIFPEAVKTSDGKRFPIKVSKYTYELLPKHCGSVELLDIILTGPPSSSKTITTLEYSDPSFHNMLASHTNLSIQNDLPVLENNEYETLGEEFFALHLVPPATYQHQNIVPYVFYLRYTDSEDGQGKIRHLLLRLQDIDGEACLQPERMHQISFHNHIILMIGADEITDQNIQRNRNFFDSVNNLITELQLCNNPDHFCKVLLVLTKADLLFDKSEELYLENSVAINDSNRMVQTIHTKGFDYKAFNHRSSSLEEYLKNNFPNFYNTLKNNFNEHEITFSFIANIGSKVDSEEGTFETFLPFAIDEPLLYLLTQNNFYPVLTPDSLNEEDIENCFKNDSIIFNLLSLLKKNFSKMIK